MLDTTHADELLSKTKGRLFFKKGAGFLGSLLCNMQFAWIEDEEICDTAMVDGVTLSWNYSFFMDRCTPDMRVTILAHELWHVAFGHMHRMMERDHEVYNIAADHVINLMLEDHGYDMSGFGYYKDKKYTDWSTDQVYEDIMKNPHPKGGGFSKGGRLGKDIKRAPKGTSQSEIMNKVIQAVTVARMTNRAGDIPGEVSIVIDKFLNPKLPWERILRNYFNDMVEMEYSMRRPNRRYHDPILPGLIGLTGLEHLMFGQDVSGSISDHDILVFNSELKFIKEEFNPRKMTMMTFDTIIQDTYVFEEDDPYEKIIVNGRGGTCLLALWEIAKKEQPNCLVVFTDLYVTIPPNPGVPVIWIVTKNPSVTVPYGKLINIKD